ncbi:hypothetical protein JTB14_021183 [Gonioctena quinquepunctata]|nr:hypothetical protein JTB14_021183 [Gonioctena quinquepunctata]
MVILNNWLLSWDIRLLFIRVPIGFQSAKLSKLLLLMEKGGADNYRGKTLEEINLNMEENLLEGNEETEEPNWNESDMDEEIHYINTETSVVTNINGKTINETVIPEVVRKKRRGY